MGKVLGAGTGRGGFLWLGLTVVQPLVLLGFGSMFSIGSCFPAASLCSRTGAIGRLREEGEGGTGVGRVSRQPKLRKGLRL